MKKSLRDRVKEFSIILPFMEGREKGEFSRLHRTICTIVDFGFIKSGDSSSALQASLDNDEKKAEKDDYVSFIIAEDKKNFYFGGKVLTMQLKELDAEGYTEEIQEHGLPVYFGTKKSKNKREYTTVEFYPVEEEDKK